MQQSWGWMENMEEEGDFACEKDLMYRIRSLKHQSFEGLSYGLSFPSIGFFISNSKPMINNSFLRIFPILAILHVCKMSLRVTFESVNFLLILPI